MKFSVQHKWLMVIYFLLFAIFSSKPGSVFGDEGADDKGFEMSPRAHFDSALKEEQNANWEKAAEHLKRVIEAYPTWSKAQLELASVLLETKNKNLDEIKSLLDKCEWGEGKNARFLYLKGRLNEEKNNYNEAIDAYKGALQIRASYEDAKAALDRVEKKKAEKEKEATQPKAVEAPPAVQPEKKNAEKPENVAKKTEAKHETAKLEQKPAEIRTEKEAAKPVEPEKKGAETPKEKTADEAVIAMAKPKKKEHIEKAVPVSDKTKSAEKLFQEGKQLMFDERYNEALVKFNEAAELYPSWGLCQLELAIAHFKADYDLAAIGSALDLAAVTENSNPRYYYWRARYLESTGEEEKAVEVFKKALAMRPQIYDAEKRIEELERIIASQKTRDKKNVGEISKKEDKIQKTNADAALEMLGESAFSKKAVTSLSQLQKARERLAKGIALAEEGNFSSAKTKVEEAITLAPFWQKARLEMARIALMDASNINRAERELIFTLQLDPSCVEAYKLLASVYEVKDDEKSAVKIISIALELEPDNAELYVSRARLYLSNNETKNAIEDYKHAYALQPKRSDAAIALALLLEKQGDVASAEKIWLSLIDSFPANATFYRKTAEFYERGGEKEKAAQYQKKAYGIEHPQKKKELRPLKESKDAKGNGKPH